MRFTAESRRGPMRNDKAHPAVAGTTEGKDQMKSGMGASSRGAGDPGGVGERAARAKGDWLIWIATAAEEPDR
jgi:hypothetical protein